MSSPQGEVRSKRGRLVKLSSRAKEESTPGHMSQGRLSPEQPATPLSRRVTRALSSCLASSPTPYVSDNTTSRAVTEDSFTTAKETSVPSSDKITSEAEAASLSPSMISSTNSSNDILTDKMETESDLAAAYDDEHATEKGKSNYPFLSMLNRMLYVPQDNSISSTSTTHNAVAIKTQSNTKKSYTYTPPKPGNRILLFIERNNTFNLRDLYYLDDLQHSASLEDCKTPFYVLCENIDKSDLADERIDDVELWLGLYKVVLEVPSECRGEGVFRGVKEGVEKGFVELGLECEDFEGAVGAAARGGGGIAQLRVLKRHNHTVGNSDETDEG